MASSYSESEAVFNDKVRTSGLAATDQTNVLAGLKNLKQLAFVSSYTPGQSDEGPLIAAFDALVKRDTSTTSLPAHASEHCSNRLMPSSRLSSGRP